jgi:hypothetical protein
VIKRFILNLLAILVPAACLPQEVIYHVFERSFFDANGDHQGDLKGLRQKLDYLQQLGVTSVLLSMGSPPRTCCRPSETPPRKFAKRNSSSAFLLMDQESG